MRENKYGWRKETERKRNNRNELLSTIAGFVTLIVIMYVVISLGSLAQKIIGEDVAYMPFWHAPWQWLILLIN